MLAIGTAIQNARTSYLGDAFNRDGTHLDYDKGCYIAGMVLVCGLTGYTPDAVTFAPEGLEERAILVAKESASNALTTKYEVTNSIYQ